MTGADVNAKINPLPGASHQEGATTRGGPCSPTATVRFMGEAIAVIVAESEEIARDAADQVVVDLRWLPAVLDLDSAAAKTTRRWSTIAGFEHLLRPAHHARRRRGRVRTRDVIVERRIVNQRVAALPMECRASLAEYRRGEGSLVVYAGTQFPHVMRNQIACAPRLAREPGARHCPRGRRRLRRQGQRLSRRDPGAVAGDEARADRCAGSRTAARTWRRWLMVATRSTTSARRAPKDGVVLGLKGRLLADLGAYLYFGTAEIPTLTTLMGTGPYRVHRRAVRPVRRLHQQGADRCLSAARAVRRRRTSRNA